MKTLLSTTALVFALGFPTLTLAQTTPAETTPATGQQTMEMQGFLAARGQSDLFASELMGHDVYARRVPAEMTGTADQATTDQVTAGQPVTNADGTHSTAQMSRADLDHMDNIGQINDIVLSNDGQVRAIVIGVGGFLGMGEQDVAVTMDQVTFASDPDDRTEMFIVVNTDAQMLQSSPAYDRTPMTDETAMTTDSTPGVAPTATERTAFEAPRMERDGYDQVAVTEVSSDLLVGQTVYDVNDASVGNIDDLLLDDQGAVTNVVIDFGGFLGIGTSQVSVGFDELTILADEGRSDVRVYVDATREQVQAQPQYRAVN